MSHLESTQAGEALLTSAVADEMSFPDLLRRMCLNLPEVRELEFPTYLLGPGISERLAKKGFIPEELSQSGVGRKGRMPSLWDEIAGVYANSDRTLPDDILREILVHLHDERERTHILTRQEFLTKGIADICNQLPTDQGLALCSLLRVEEGYRLHLPMLDFACDPTEANRNTLKKMLEMIGQKGMILNSGASFHFIGVSLLTTEEWVRFMGQSLLLAPYIDSRFVGHRLLDGQCNLRLFASGKRPQTPFVQACVGF